MLLIVQFKKYRLTSLDNTEEFTLTSSNWRDGRKLSYAH